MKTSTLTSSHLQQIHQSRDTRTTSRQTLRTVFLPSINNIHISDSSQPHQIRQKRERPATMSSPMTQTSQHGLALTAEILRPVNSLTRASPKPGFLDCDLIHHSCCQRSLTSRQRFHLLETSGSRWPCSELPPSFQFAGTGTTTQIVLADCPHPSVSCDVSTFREVAYSFQKIEAIAKPTSEQNKPCGAKLTCQMSSTTSDRHQTGLTKST